MSVSFHYYFSLILIPELRNKLQSLFPSVPKRTLDNVLPERPGKLIRLVQIKYQFHNRLVPILFVIL